MALPRFYASSLVVAAGLATPLAGCSRPAAPTEIDPAQGVLSDIWEMYDGYVLQHHKPPTQMSDFKGLQVPFPRGHTELTAGRYVVRFGTPLEPAGKLLAYPKDAPQKGGMVLLNDGTTKSMTADEIQAAIK
ncbi:MAG TPA: hypothetical protein VGF55_10630 [Gemmataceae bacterium]|jgi:hypothetical protein